MPRRRVDVAGAVVGVGLMLAGAGAAELADGSATTAGVTASAAPAPPPRVMAAVDELLGQLEVAEEPPRDGFDREKEFPHWSTVPGTACDTRERVLAVEKDKGRTNEDCRVENGSWFSVYDGEHVTEPSTLDVDHMVALAEAWDSGAGGEGWDKERRRRYANDLGYEDSLIAVTDSSNRSKSDNDPAEWQPARKRVWCRYATAWTTVKIRWGLTADEEEVEALRAMFKRCTQPPETRVALAS